jgi:lycopene cyclase-like protein
VVGAGPAALCLATALGQRGLRVEALAQREPDHPWANTYGIWGREVDGCGLSHLLAHRWSDTVSWFGPEPTPHGQDYGLFDKARLQAHWLAEVERAGLRWHRGRAAAIDHDDAGSVVDTVGGEALRARLVIDASGHEPVFVRRPDDGPVAGQAAYGIVGRFSAPPVAAGQFVLMDYRSDHLGEAERGEPPTFLYAMDLGGGVYFVEETSLALAPALPFAVLRDRLQRRLAHRGVRVEEIHEQEHCLFPMNPALPDRHQRVVGFGGAASMVHPASGYMVGSLLRRAPALAEAIAAACDAPGPSAPGPALSRAAWEALWPGPLRRKHALYRFGLEKLMRFDDDQLRHFFGTFFRLPPHQWQGFLTNTLTVPQLVRAMAGLFVQAPADVRWGLMVPRDRELDLLGKVLDPDAAVVRPFPA